MQIKAILFDKDGTLFDFQKTWGRWVFDELTLLSEGDGALSVKLADAIGFDMREKLVLAGSPIIAGTAEDSARLMLPLLPKHTLETLVADGNKRAALVKPHPVLELGPFLDGLIEAGLTVGVATNDSEVAAISQLKELQVDDRFSYIVGYDSGFGAKPDAGMCSEFARRLDLDPSSVAMVGDSSHDIDAGNAAGMTTVAVLTGLADRSELEKTADVVLRDIGELPDWLA